MNLDFLPAVDPVGDVPAECPPYPEFPPPQTLVTFSVSQGTIFMPRHSVTMNKRETEQELELQLQPEEVLVIGRQKTGEIEYLDPLYQPTCCLPFNDYPVYVLTGKCEDICLSRGHFTLKGGEGGLRFTNGVPRRGGGIRPPLNGTWLLKPHRRQLNPCEEVHIAPGEAITLALPNRVKVTIKVGG